MSNTYYVRTDGNDSHNGLANTAGGAFLTVAHAYSVASTGDTVTIGAGTFAEGNAFFDASAKNLIYVGAGSGSTTITSTLSAATGSIFSGGSLTGFKVQGIAVSYIVQGIGWQGGSPAANNPWSTMTLNDITFQNESDGLFFKTRSDNTGVSMRVTARNGTTLSAFDAHSQLSTAWDGVVEYYDYTLTVVGPNNSGSHFFRGVSANDGIVRLYRCTIDVTPNDGSAITTAGMVTAGAGAAQLEAIGSTITLHSATAGTVNSIKAGGNGKIFLTNCTYDAAKVYATNPPIICTIGGSGPFATYIAGLDRYSLTYTDGGDGDGGTTALDTLLVNDVDVSGAFGAGAVTWDIPTDFTIGSALNVDIKDSNSLIQGRIDQINVTTTLAATDDRTVGSSISASLALTAGIAGGKLRFTGSSQGGSPTVAVAEWHSEIISNKVGATACAIDLGGSTIAADATLTSQLNGVTKTDGTGGTIGNFTQLRASGQQAKYATVTGGVEGSHAQGSTYSGTISASLIAAGFTPTKVLFTGPDDVDTPTFDPGSTFSVPTPLTTGLGSTTVSLFDEVHGITLNLDTITMTEAPTASIDQDTAPRSSSVQGSTSGFIPTGATIGGVAVTSFVYSPVLEFSGRWSGTVDPATPLGSEEVVLSDGDQDVGAGSITVTVAATTTQYWRFGGSTIPDEMLDDVVGEDNEAVLIPL